VFLPELVYKIRQRARRPVIQTDSLADLDGGPAQRDGGIVEQLPPLRAARAFG
jgi:hypothetical protein